MSAMGQQRTLQCILVMSALPPEADIGVHAKIFLFSLPKAQFCGACHILFLKRDVRRQVLAASRDDSFPPETTLGTSSRL